MQQQVLPVLTTWCVHLPLHQLHRAATGHKDLDGFTCTPEIAPPIARTVDRDSGTFGVQTYEYGEVEIASEVGWENYKRVADGIMRLYNITGLLHGYSYNWWSDLAVMDNARLLLKSGSNHMPQGLHSTIHSK